MLWTVIGSVLRQKLWCNVNWKCAAWGMSARQKMCLPFLTTVMPNCFFLLPSTFMKRRQTECEWIKMWANFCSLCQHSHTFFYGRMAVPKHTNKKYHRERPTLFFWIIEQFKFLAALYIFFPRNMRFITCLLAVFMRPFDFEVKLVYTVTCVRSILTVLR